MTDIGHIGTSRSSLGIAGSAASNRLEDQNQTQVSTQTSRSVQAGDRIELSEHAEHLLAIKNLPEVRQDKIAAARAALENGSLDTPSRLENAVEQLLVEWDLG